MSYDITLYRPEFLRRAIAANLGDWTNADPIPPSTMEAIISRLLSQGYVEQSYPWLIGRCFVHPRHELQIEANVFKGSLSFGVSYGPHAMEGAEVATTEAKAFASAFELAFCDPASGEIVSGT